MCHCHFWDISKINKKRYWAFNECQDVFFRHWLGATQLAEVTSQASFLTSQRFNLKSNCYYQSRSPPAVMLRSHKKRSKFLLHLCSNEHSYTIVTATGTIWWYMSCPRTQHISRSVVQHPAQLLSPQSQSIPSLTASLNESRIMGNVFI